MPEGSCWKQSSIYIVLSVHFQGNPFNIQIYASTSNAEKAEVEWFYEDLQDLLEITPQKMSFSL